jgi:hypothetical protein
LPWLVNPHDINGMKQALLDAFSADPAHADVARWAADFLEQLSRTPR